jgi:carnitine O-acetyltransferase
MGEHSVMDGTPTTRMCDEVLDALYDPAFDRGSSASSSLPTPQALDWHVSKETEKAIERATAEAKALIGSQTMGYRLTRYGKKVRPFVHSMFWSLCEEQGG